MNDIHLNYKDSHYQWSEQLVEKKLKAIGNLEGKKTAWICKDLELKASHGLARLIWTVVAKFFHWMRERFYGVDLEMSRSLLAQIGVQVQGDGKFSKLYLTALETFSQIAPRHGFSKAMHNPCKFENEIKSSALRLIKQGITTQEILSCMSGTKYTDEELLILIHQVKAEPEKFSRPITEKSASPSKSEPIAPAIPKAPVITAKHQENSAPEKPKPQIKSEISKSHHFDHETIETLIQLVQQGMNTQDILLCMQGSKFTDKQLEGLIEQIKANPKKSAIPHSVKTSASSTSTQDPSSPSHKPPSVVGVAEHSSSKEQKTLIQAAFTQFDPKFKDEGKSACTCINLTACEYLLRTENFAEISEIGLNHALDDGIALWKKSSALSEGEHLDILEADFSALKVKIAEEKGLFGGTTKQEETLINFGGVLKVALKCHQAPFAIIFTKQPETVSVTVRSPNEFWLFDPHGDPSKGRKAFVEKFSSLEATAKALHDRFPYVDPESIDIFDQQGKFYFETQYNVFSASIVVK